jgi:hypothetical protein
MRRPFIPFLVLILLSSTVLFAQQKSWWDRFLPPNNPQVLTSAANGKPTAALVTPHPDVLQLQNSFAAVADAV